MELITPEVMAVNPNTADPAWAIKNPGNTIIISGLVLIFLENQEIRATPSKTAPKSCETKTPPASRLTP